jgi:hypothetical protein
MNIRLNTGNISHLLTRLFFFFAQLILDHEDGGDTLLRNVFGLPGVISQKMVNLTNAIKS